jgi:hypothetical protein
MPTMSDIFRKITIQSTAPGASETADALLKIATAQGNVAIATERSEKSVLSMESKLHKLKLSLDEEYRSEEKLAQIEKTLHAARLQGAVSIEEQNRLLGLAKLKYTEAGEAAKVMGERMETAKELAKGLLMGLGAGLVLTGLAEVPAKITEAVKSGAELKATAETIGIAASNLQELDYAAKLTDVSTETMNSALEKFSKNLGQASSGTGELAKILKANHVAISGNLTTDLENYANLVQHATNAEERNFLTTTAFGKNASELGRLFNNGAEGIKALGVEAENTGAILSDATLNSAEELNREFTKMHAQLDVAFQTFLISNGPALIDMLRGITEAVKAATAVGAFLNPSQSTIENRYRAANGIATPANNSGSPDDRSSTPPALEITVRGANTRLPPAPGTGTKADPYAKVTESLNAQIRALTESNREQLVANELAKAGDKITVSQAANITALAGKYYDEKQAIEAANQAANFLAQSTETAFEGIITGSSSVQDALAGIVKALAQAVIQAELLGSGPLAGILGTSPTTSGGAGGILGSLFSALIPHANGGVYNSPSLSAYSNQVVTKPTLFAFANGGVMGEAGPEAIMPLRRGPDGKLGVSAANSNAVAPSIVYAPVYNFQSASIEELARIKAQAAADRESFAVRVQKAMGDKRTR